MKIIAQDRLTVRSPPGRHTTFFLVEDDTPDDIVNRGHAKGWVVSTAAPAELREVWNGTWALAHAGWFPFTGEQSILDELLKT